MTKIIDLDDHRGPGRKRRPGRQPSRYARARRDRFNAALDQFTKADPVVVAVQGDAVESLYVARDAVAREAASLLFERLRAVPASREASRISSRRVAALAEIARLTIAIHRANPGQPSPERLGRVLESLQGEVEDAARKLFDPEGADRLIADLRARLADPSR